MTGNLTLEQAKQLAETIATDLPLGKAANPLPEPQATRFKDNVFTFRFLVRKQQCLWDNWAKSGQPTLSLNSSRQILRSVMIFWLVAILMRG